MNRKERILVPSAVALISIGSTLWLASGGTQNPIRWFNDLPPGAAPQFNAMLGFLVSAGIVTVGLGYLCSAVFTLYMLQSEKCRLIDFSKMMYAFGLRMREDANKKSVRRDLQDRLLDEFHIRLHSHAPQSLIDHCSRRNTVWYLAKTSAFASIVGWLAALWMIYARDGFLRASCWWQIAGVVASGVVFLVVIPLALWQQGTRWNREYWGVCWKWIAWDLQSNQAPSDWLGPLPEGAERIRDG